MIKVGTFRTTVKSTLVQIAMDMLAGVKTHMKMTPGTSETMARRHSKGQNAADLKEGNL
jgi:hypothetical protein